MLNKYLLNEQTYIVPAVVLPVLQLRTQRLREIKKLASGPTVNGRVDIPTQVHLTPQLMLLTIMHPTVAGSSAATVSSGCEVP